MLKKVILLPNYNCQMTTILLQNNKIVESNVNLQNLKNSIV